MNLAQFIDHTILKPQATVDDITRLCSEAAENKFAAVCINPVYVDLSAHLLKGTGVKVATVIGFPLGSTLTAVKVFETREAVIRRADELDMVINLSAAKMGCWDVVSEDIKQVVYAADGKLVKVIIEAALLSDDEKRRACQAVIDGGAHFVKTSTGFGPGGATVEDVKLFKRVVGNAIRIKAAGGIRNRQDAEAMIAAGAARIGTSAGVEIVR